MNVKSRLDKLEHELKPWANDLPVMVTEQGYVEITDHFAFFQLVLDWMQNGIMEWGYKDCVMGNMFFAGPNHEPGTDQDCEDFRNIGFALRGFFKSHVPIEHTPQDTPGMIALLEGALHEQRQ